MGKSSVGIRVDVGGTFADVVLERVMLAFPGGAGYGRPEERDAALIKRDLARAYFSAETIISEYVLGEAGVASVLEAVRLGEEIS